VEEVTKGRANYEAKLGELFSIGSDGDELAVHP
jgi:hypothetical protein